MPRPTAAAAAAAAEGLPLVADRRTSGEPPAVGGRLDALDLDVATRLLSLVPADVGSAAPAAARRRRRARRLDAHPDGRRTRGRPSSASTARRSAARTMIPEQVRLLRSLLAGREAQLLRVVLAGSARGHVHAEAGAVAVAGSALRSGAPGSGSLRETQSRRGNRPVLLPLAGLLVGILLGLVLNVNVGFELSRYSAVAILAALDSVLGAVRAELDGVYNNRIFLSGFVVNAIVAVLLTFIGDRLGLDLYLVALITFGLRIFQNVALIRRHFL